MQIRQKRVTREYFSIVRRSALWASPVIESASSKMMSLKGGAGFSPPGPSAVLETEAWAKVFTLSRMIAIPRSSLAFSSSTRVLNNAGP